MARRSFYLFSQSYLPLEVFFLLCVSHDRAGCLKAELLPRAKWTSLPFVPGRWAANHLLTCECSSEDAQGSMAVAPLWLPIASCRGVLVLASQLPWAKCILPDKGPDLLHWRRSHLSLPSQDVSKTSQDSNQRLLGSVRLQEESVWSRVSEYDTATVRSLGLLFRRCRLSCVHGTNGTAGTVKVLRDCDQATAACYGTDHDMD